MNEVEWFLVVGLVIVNLIMIVGLLLYGAQTRKEGYAEGYAQGKDEYIGRSMSKIHLIKYRIEEIDYHIMENSFEVVGICGKYLRVKLYRKDLCNFFGEYWVEFDDKKELEVVKKVPGYFKFTHNGKLLKA